MVDKLAGEIQNLIRLLSTDATKQTLDTSIREGLLTRADAIIVQVRDAMVIAPPCPLPADVAQLSAAIEASGDETQCKCRDIILKRDALVNDIESAFSSAVDSMRTSLGPSFCCSVGCRSSEA